MLINRLIKPDSNLYKDLSNKSKQYDFFMDWDPLRWFGMWCMALSGFNIVKGSEYRYIFWDWSSGTGFIYLVLFIVTISIILFKSWFDISSLWFFKSESIYWNS